MNTLKLLLVLGSMVTMPFFMYAQDRDQLPWQVRDRANNKPLPYEYVREADVMWSKKIWRTIDLREKMNLPYAYPQRPLIQILHEAAKRGDIKAYDPAVDNADQFRVVMDTAVVARIGCRIDTVITLDPISLAEKPTVVHEELPWDRIVKYRIKEIWFFDTHTSTMQARIIGIAPVMEDRDASGHVRGDRVMYWLYYPDLRDMLAREEAFNPDNDQASLSWEDILESRRFQSYIYKESNVYDRAITEYASGIDAQLESDRIKNQMMEFEHDLWSY